MKRIIMFLSLSLVLISLSAQTISPEYFDSYRSQATKLSKDGSCREAISMYIMLAKSGDAQSAKEIAKLYEKGGCLGKSSYQAAEWRAMQKTLKKESPNLSKATMEKLTALEVTCGLFTQVDEEEVPADKQ